MLNDKSKYVENIRKIKKWMEQNKATKPPTASAKNTEERKLGQMISNIRQNVIKPFNLLNTDEERTEFLKKHKGAEEVIEIVNWIDTNNVSVKLQQAREIKRWMEERDTKKPPRIKGTEVSKEEKRLGKALDAIRQYLIKPYESLRTEKEKEEFRKKHRDLEEVIAIVEEIDMNNPKREILEKAKRTRDKARRKKEEAKVLQERVKEELSKKEISK